MEVAGAAGAVAGAVVPAAVGWPVPFPSGLPTGVGACAGGVTLAGRGVLGEKACGDVAAGEPWPANCHTLTPLTASTAAATARTVAVLRPAPAGRPGPAAPPGLPWPGGLQLASAGTWPAGKAAGMAV